MNTHVAVTAFDYSALPPETEVVLRDERIYGCHSQIRGSVAKIGRQLRRAKERADHGRF